MEKWTKGQNYESFYSSFHSIDNRKKTKKNARQAYILNTILLTVAITKNNF